MQWRCPHLTVYTCCIEYLWVKEAATSRSLSFSLESDDGIRKAVHPFLLTN